MSYRIAGIDLHKKVLAVVVSSVEIAKSMASTSLSGGCSEAIPNNCARWQHGSSSKRPKKLSWNRRHNIGNHCGKRWKLLTS